MICPNCRCTISQNSIGCHYCGYRFYVGDEKTSPVNNQNQLFEITPTQRNNHYTEYKLDTFDSNPSNRTHHRDAIEPERCFVNEDESNRWSRFKRFGFRELPYDKAYTYDEKYGDMFCYDVKCSSRNRLNNLRFDFSVINQDGGLSVFKLIALLSLIDGILVLIMLNILLLVL